MCYILVITNKTALIFKLDGRDKWFLLKLKHCIKYKIFLQVGKSDLKNKAKYVTTRVENLKGHAQKQTSVN